MSEKQQNTREERLAEEIRNIAVLNSDADNYTDLLRPKLTPPLKIQNLKAAMDKIIEIINNGQTIKIFGDYDVDGIASSTILYYTLRKYAEKVGADFKNIKIKIPKRFSDGYGFSTETEKTITEEAIITIDNGIVSFDAIQKAKERGKTVVILDHHLGGEKLPNADVIVDLHMLNENNVFNDLCAAGLAYKLAQLFQETHCIFDADDVKRITVYAALGTIADSVSLVHDNRAIVKTGIRVLNCNAQNSGWITEGFGKILLESKIEKFDEKTIAFKLIPMLNAPGRMHDDGAEQVCKSLFCNKPQPAIANAAKFAQDNATRKQMTDVFVAKCLRNISGGEAERVICKIVEGTPEGIIGIVAGKVVEKYQKPAFIFTRTEGENGFYKGSARSCNGFDLTAILEKIKPYCIGCGGHAGAAGISCAIDAFENVSQIITNFDLPKIESAKNNYDLEIPADFAQDAYKIVQQFRPFGMGNPDIVFKFVGFDTSLPSYTLMQEGKSIRLHLTADGKEIAGVNFGEGQQFKKVLDGFKNAPKLDVIGTFQTNTFRGRTQTQINVVNVDATKL